MNAQRSVTRGRGGRRSPAPTSARASAVLVLAIVLAWADDAQAYVDPGTGSYLFQMAVAGALAGVYVLRRYWYAVKAYFTGRTAASDREAESPPDRPHGMD